MTSRRQTQRQKINLITPPTANNRGSANLQYGFEMPPARNGMAPSLGIQYSSEAVVDGLERVGISLFLLLRWIPVGVYPVRHGKGNRDLPYVRIHAFYHGG